MQIGVAAARAVATTRIFVVDLDAVTCAGLTFIVHDEHEVRDLETAFRKGRDGQPDLTLLGLAIV